MATIETQHNACPDGGSCHHGCAEGNCFRVGFCGPLSGVYPSDLWPEGLRFDDATHLSHLGRLATQSDRSGKERSWAT